MPTFASGPLMNLIEPRASGKPLYLGEPNMETETRFPTPMHLYIKPALYITPQLTPIPDSVSPDHAFSSPYVVNHNHRRGLDHKGRAHTSQVSDLASGKEGGSCCVEEGLVNDFENENGVFHEENNDYMYLDARSEASVIAEFMDANEDFSQDGSCSNSPLGSYNLEESLHSTKLNIAEEIDRRIVAEESMRVMQNQWNRIHALFIDAGINAFPALDMEIDECCINELMQELTVSKLVAESIGAGIARADAEEAFTTIIQLKEEEIQRLHDRVQYYETVNHEMSQRKLLEVARRKHDEKKKNRRMWSLMGISVAAIGASLLAYAYIYDANKSSSILGDSEKH